MTSSSQLFYRAFEDRYRGSRELIKSRLKVYLPFILPLKQFDQTCKGIDLGCGRGEWLELMQDNGINVQGVDIDQGMLDAARERGLNANYGDAIQVLQALMSESQMLISGFHIAEHLPFEVLKTLVDESLRVLKPGGLLILQTPNPENIVVGTANFYLDPTHNQPIPSQLLSFIAEYAGFAKIKVLRLQEPRGLADNNALTLLNILNGVSPDYAVIAQKAGTPEIITATAQAFESDYGLSLENLANSYDQQIKTKAK
jgi:SAM-dependent methyltransferase